MTQFEICASGKPKLIELESKPEYTEAECENYDDMDF